jgi:hypothetical protein
MPTTIEELAQQQSAIKRRQAIAEQLMKRSQEPLETNNVAGGYVVPVSPLQAIDKVVSALSASYMAKKADDRQLEFDVTKRAAQNKSIYEGYGITPPISQNVEKVASTIQDQQQNNNPPAATTYAYNDTPTNTQFPTPAPVEQQDTGSQPTPMGAANGELSFDEKRVKIMTNDMIPDTLKTLMVARIDREEKAMRPDAPAGYTIGANGDLRRMKVEGGGTFTDDQIAIAGGRAAAAEEAKNAIPPTPYEIEDHNFKLESQGMQKKEFEQRQEDRNKPKPLSEFQQYALDEKKAKKEAEFNESIANIDDTIGEFETLATVQKRTMTGPVSGSSIIAGIRKRIPGDNSEDLQTLEKGYNTLAVRAIGAFKAGGVTFGALSKSEGDWVKSTQASLDSDTEVNKASLDHGIKLLKARRARIMAQNGTQETQPQGTTTPAPGAVKFIGFE